MEIRYNLIKEGKIDDKETTIEKEYIDERFIGLEERGVLYETWLKTHSSRKDWSAYRYVQQPYKINKYIIENSHRNSDSYLVSNEGILSKSSDVLKLLSREKVNNRPTHREIVKDSVNLKHDEIYTLKTISNIVENTLTNIFTDYKTYDNKKT